MARLSKRNRLGGTAPKNTAGSPPQRSARELAAQANDLRSVRNDEQAEALLREAVALDAGCADAWACLGCLLIDGERFAEAAACLRRAAGIKRIPVSPRTEENPRLEATVLLGRLVDTHPSWVRGRLSLAMNHVRAGKNEAARELLAGAVSLEPALARQVDALSAQIYWKEQRWSEAVACADRALAAGPGNWSVHAARSLAQGCLGNTEAEVEGLRRAVALHPEPNLHSRLIFLLNHLAGTTPEEVLAEACRWESLYAAPLAGEIRPHANPRDPERRLKVGYVSPDLHDRHPMMKFLPPFFEHHDRSQFEIFIYAAPAEVKPDATTEQLSRSFENFRFHEGSSAALAERIRADGIDLLIDLAGFTTTPDTLLVFARKPAPVQATWMGFPCTTGLSTIDYFIGDPQMPCPGTEHLFRETVYRLPRVNCCYRPAAEVPVAPAPCLTRGYVTFGAFHKPIKITRETVRLWSVVLRTVGRSHLLLKYYGLEKEENQRRFREWFAEDGIERERVEFAGASPAAEYLRAYGGIDIALDPFPHNGGSTTYDALWMGVPVVTLAGRLAVQRCGASILTATGMGDTIAETPEQYVAAAQFLADVAPRIPMLRANVREALRRSPFMDEAGTIRDVEAAFREMWRAWCHKHGGGG